MKIQINFDSDKVIITDNSVVGIEIKVTRPTEILAVLIELLNILDVKDVSLEKIDEGTIKIVDEW